jgi:tRNA-specific 2-thiouridylase
MGTLDSLGSNQCSNIIVGMSGGVDSSVAALLLQRQGHKVEGLFMKNWEEDDDEVYCSATEDLNDATQIADQLGICLRTRNFSTEYWNKVFESFLSDYRLGLTPNPDVICNNEIKFKAFLDYALELGADFIATGHYARIKYSNGHYRLLKSIDANKDQTYFLHGLNQRQLSHSLFPLGELKKPEVRRLAEQMQFSNYAKKDSTGICFIGERKFKEFLSRYLPAQPGEIRDTEGTYLGNHQGLMYYTLGQRQGLGIGGLAGSSGEPWYVVDKDMGNNILIITQGHDHPRLYNLSLIAHQLHWIAEPPQTVPYRCNAKIRYRQSDQECTIISLQESTCEVKFVNRQWAITPGQSVVFYEGDQCLGGGIIQDSKKTSNYKGNPIAT